MIIWIQLLKDTIPTWKQLNLFWITILKINFYEIDGSLRN